MCDCATGLFHSRLLRLGQLRSGVLPSHGVRLKKTQLKTKAANSQKLPKQFQKDVGKQKEQSGSVDQHMMGAPEGKAFLPQDDVCMRGEPEAEGCSASTPNLSCELQRYDSGNDEPEAEANPSDEETDCWHKGTEQMEGTSNEAAVQAAPAEKEPVALLAEHCGAVDSTWAGVAFDHFQSFHGGLPSGSTTVADVAQGGRLEAAIGEQCDKHEEPEGSKNRAKNNEKPMCAKDEDVEELAPEDEAIDELAPAVDNYAEKQMQAEDEDVEKPVAAGDEDVEKRVAKDKATDELVLAEDEAIEKLAPAADKYVENHMPAEYEHVEKRTAAGDQDIEKRVAEDEPTEELALAEDEDVEKRVAEVLMQSRHDHKTQQTGPEQQEISVDLGRHETTPVDSLVSKSQEPQVIEYSLEQLTNQQVWRKLAIEPTTRETLLGDVKFQELFGMDKQAFAKLPKWKRDTLKKKVQLF